jgi:SAM-dependent methyltransferase
VNVELYDRIGRSYGATRRADPRIARAIRDALADARTLVNVGAGIGAYEPPDLDVVAVEPSPVMAAQRPPGSAKAISAYAEQLPFEDASFDASMAILSDHHWADRAAGLRELRRVARDRALVFTWDQSRVDDFWMTRDYLDGFRRLPGMTIEQIAEHLGGAQVIPVPIPHDCTDGFYHAWWRRPHAYLDPTVRAGISVFGRLPQEECERAVSALARDLASGAWEERNGDLLTETEHDWGYRLLVATI